jgi:N-acetylmuramoyl-L-alanine amidase
MRWNPRTRQFVRMSQIDPGVVRLIDPNGRDWGDNVEAKESDIVLEISKLIKESLQRQSEVRVFLTRSGEINLFNQTALDTNALSFRWIFANEKNADLLISIHVNGAGTLRNHGFEILYHETTAENISLAESIIASQETMPIAQRRHYQQDSGALRGFEGIAAVLVELGYMNIDADYINITTRQREIANEIATGIINYISRII